MKQGVWKVCGMREATNMFLQKRDDFGVKKFIRFEYLHLGRLSSILS